MNEELKILKSQYYNCTNEKEKKDLEKKIAKLEKRLKYRLRINKFFRRK